MPDVRLQSLLCNHCGAPVDVPAAANYTTCAHCGSRLRVHRSDTAAWTEQVEVLAERTERIEAKVDDLSRTSAVDRLDREWDRARERYMVTGKHGAKSVPSKVGGVAAGVVIAAFGGLWTAFAAGMGAPSVFPLFGLAFVAFGLFNAVRVFQRAEGYERAEAEYRRERARLLAEEERP